jgi:hypothetical protein
MYVFGVVVQPLLKWKINKYYIIWVGIFSLRYPAWIVLAPYFHVACPALQEFFPCLINGTIFEKGYWTRNMCFDFFYKFYPKKVFEHEICVLIFSTNFIRKRFLNTKYVFWFSLQILSEKKVFEHEICVLIFSTNFIRKSLLNTKHVFWISLQILSEKAFWKQHMCFGILYKFYPKNIIEHEISVLIFFTNIIWKLLLNLKYVF